MEIYLFYHSFDVFNLSHHQSNNPMNNLDFFRLLLFKLLILLALPVFSQTFTISGTAYLDYSDDGLLNEKDLVHPALTVQIFSDTNGNGAIDVGEPMIGSSISGLNGAFSIEIDHSGGIPLDDYLIQIDTNDLVAGSTTTTLQRAAGNTNVNVPFRGEPVLCYAVADAGIDQLFYMNRISGTNTASTGNLNATEIETAAFELGGKQLFAINANELGTIDLVTGTFVPKGIKIGSIRGADGETTVTDVDGMSFDPYTGKLWAAVRRAAAMTSDLLFQIDTATGTAVLDAFGVGIDYVVIDGPGLDEDIDDIAINPADGKLYAVNNGRAGGGNLEEYLVEIDKATGAATIVGQLAYTGPITGLAAIDIEGFGFTNFGLLIATTGSTGPFDTRNRMYTVDLSSGALSLIGKFDSGTDFESCDCLIGAENIISGSVYEDTNRNEMNDGQGPLPGVKIKIYIDIDGDGMLGPNDLLVDSTFSAADGTYSWETASNVPIVMEIDPGTLPTGYASTDDGIEMVDLSCCFGGVSAVNNDFGAFTAVFPVEWVSFTAEYKDKASYVNWITASELNSDYFQVERSVDGRSFWVLDRVEAQGIASRPTSYQYIDKTVVSLGLGNVYYRLKQVDIDGSVEYSPRVQVSIPLTAFELEVYPNPVSNTLYLRYNSPEISEVRLSLIDLRGKSIRETALTNTDQISWDVSDLASGLYYLRVNDQGRLSYRKLMVR